MAKQFTNEQIEENQPLIKQLQALIEQKQQEQENSRKKIEQLNVEIVNLKEERKAIAIQINTMKELTGLKDKIADNARVQVLQMLNKMSERVQALSDIINKKKELVTEKKNLRAIEKGLRKLGADVQWLQAGGSNQLININQYTQEPSTSATTLQSQESSASVSTPQEVNIPPIERTENKSNNEINDQTPKYNVVEPNKKDSKQSLWERVKNKAIDVLIGLEDAIDEFGNNVVNSISERVEKANKVVKNIGREVSNEVNSVSKDVANTVKNGIDFIKARIPHREYADLDGFVIGKVKVENGAVNFSDKKNAWLLDGVENSVNDMHTGEFKEYSYEFKRLMAIVNSYPASLATLPPEVAKTLYMKSDKKQNNNKYRMTLLRYSTTMGFKTREQEYGAEAVADAWNADKKLREQQDKAWNAERRALKEAGLNKDKVKNTGVPELGNVDFSLDGVDG